MAEADTGSVNDHEVPCSLTSMEKVCDFLRGRGVSREVIEKFQFEKMDVSAVSNAKDEVLIEMGLSKAGDRLSLRGFCSGSHVCENQTAENNKGKKRALLEAFLSGKNGKKSSLRSSRQRSHPLPIEKNQKKTKKIQLGWKHYKEQEQGYVLVPLAKGGGSRVVELPLSSNKFDLYKTCKTLFFPNGQSMFGKEEEMLFDLTNFKDEKIEATIKVDKNELPFNLNNYMELHKLKTVRIYLRSKKVFTYDDSGAEEETDANLVPMIEMNNKTALIGTSKERETLFMDQDRAYQESLDADKEKVTALENETNSAKRKERIQHARLARVIPEPDTNFVTVRVRHLRVGMQSRRFPSNACMSAVYDWAGSLSSDPENFNLCDPFGVVLLPISELRVSDRCTLSMAEADHGTPSMSESDNEIEFLGFGDTSTASIATLPDLEISKQDGEGLLQSAVKGNQEETSVPTIPLKDEPCRKESALDSYYASLLDTACATTSNICFGDADEVPRYDDDYKDDDDDDPNQVTEDQSAPTLVQTKELNEIISELAKEIDHTCISKFNISRNFMWEGTKRALARKSFSPKNKVSVKFTDDIGNSEGAVDLGGPMREFFTLVIQWMLDSQLFCGCERQKFLSFQSKCLEDNDYFFAGTVIAMSVVHGGPGPQYLAPKMFEALVSPLHKIVVQVEDVYDFELKTSLEMLQSSTCKEEAMRVINNTCSNLLTILDLAGTLQPIRTTGDIARIVNATARWFVLGRAQPALESFQKGLSALGVLDALKANPDAFRPVFCYSHIELSAEGLETLFTVKVSPIGSTKAITESLVLSRWHDYLQDVEEGEESLTLSDILFFATGCKALPPRKIYPSIEFLHEPEAWGVQSKFPKADTCSNTLRLPVVHATYDGFKSDITFGIQNGRGFGIA